MSLRLHHLHPWKLPPAEAQKVQEKLRSYVIAQTPTVWQPRLVGGVDASFAPGYIRAAAIVLSYPALEAIDQGVTDCPIEFPYIPGLLSFREAPAMLKALAKLSRLPDVLLVDGHGQAHPRRFGIACHLGVLLDIPTIGCAKSLLIGAHEPLAQTPGSQAKIILEGEVVGAAVRTRAGVKPVYVSVGHRVDLPTAIQLVLACGRGYRLPEPLRQAHRLAGITQ